MRRVLSSSTSFGESGSVKIASISARAESEAYQAYIPDPLRPDTTHHPRAH